ncbi:MAG TPA: hypothetical protein VGE85_11510 [Terracidiphilus sp.]|jgi:hypothetical protein
MYRHEIEDLVQAQLQMGDRRTMSYQGEDFYFSRKTIAVGTLVAGQYTFFADVANQNGITFAQTNMMASQQTSNKDSFLLKGVRFNWSYSSADTDVTFLIQNMWLNWRFFNADFFKGPPEGYPGGSAAYVTAASSLATITSTYPSPLTSIVNGAPSRSNYFRLGDDGVLITPLDQFQMILVNTGVYTTATAAAGGRGLTMTAWLDGYRIRQLA